MSRNSSNLRGFTLVELLLYVSLAAFLLLSISFLLSLMLQARVKSEAVRAVYEESSRVMRIITQQIRNAERIISPATSTNAAILSLEMSSGPINPTVFDMVGNAIRITEGASSPISLTSSRIVASNLFFHNLSRDGTTGTVRISFTLSHLSPENRNEYSFIKTFHGSATTRY